VLYLSPDTGCKIEEKRLVVEVLSPGTAKFDRQEKYQAYEKHGVREYWIVDPAHAVIEEWTLNEGQFARQGAYAAEDSFASVCLAESVTVSSIF
jgi:Uma2 family endonuclease